MYTLSRSRGQPGPCCGNLTCGAAQGNDGQLISLGKVFTQETTSLATPLRHYHDCEPPSVPSVLGRERLFSATSESLNWVAVGGAMQQEPNLHFDLVDYVPVYRTPANTGGGWAFARWQ